MTKVLVGVLLLTLISCSSGQNSPPVPLSKNATQVLSEKQKMLALERQLAEENARLDSAQKDLNYAQERYISSAREKEKADTEATYDRIARSGDAGVSEQLLAAKKAYADPYSSTANARIASNAASEMSGFKAQIDDATKTIAEKRKAIAKLNADISREAMVVKKLETK